MKKSVILIDSLALLGFLISFAPDLTGYAVHEWLGLAVGGALLIHLLQHWQWVLNVTQSLGHAKSKILIRYLVDAILMFEFFGIIVTGLVISSLLLLPLENYDTWRFLHVLSSYGTLVMLGLKIALHWEWIVKQANKMTAPKQPVAALNLNRRKFLRTGLITTAAAIIAVAEFKEWQNKTGYFPGLMDDEIDIAADNGINVVSAEESQAPMVTEEVPTSTPVSAAPESEPAEPTLEPIEPTIEPTSTSMPTVEPTVVPTEVVATGNVRCNRACSYPGKCRRYQDNNQNGKCDLGEPIW